MDARFNAIGIAVADMTAARDFYGLLGLVFHADANSDGHYEADVGNGVTLMLDTEEIMTSFDPSWEPPVSRGRIGLAFACGSPPDVDAAHQRIVAAGYRSHLDPFDAFWGQRYASVLDPDGNVIDLYAPLAREGD